MTRPLRDPAEDTPPVGVEHFDLDAIARLHERSLRLAVLDDLDHAALRQTRNSAAALGVRDRPRAEDGAGGERARLGDMRQEIVKRKVHLGGVAIADQRAVVGGAQAQVNAAVAPAFAELVGSDGERRERGGRLGVEEAKALGQLGGDEISQRHVVAQTEELDVPLGPGGAGPDGNIVENGADLGFEVEPPRGIAEHDIFRGREQRARAALIDERIGAQGFRRLGAARLANQDDVVEKRAAVDPFIGARQRCEASWATSSGCAATRPLSRSRLSWRSRGSWRGQSSSAACSVGAISAAGTKVEPVAPTTTSVPSRPPALRLPSFMQALLTRHGADRSRAGIALFSDPSDDDILPNPAPSTLRMTAT